MNNLTCRSCGSNSCVPGALQSTGSVAFRPSDAKFLTLRTADISVRAYMCLKCGTVQMVGDVDKLRIVQGARDTQACSPRG